MDFVPPAWKPGMADEILQLSTAEAKDMARRMANPHLRRGNVSDFLDADGCEVGLKILRTLGHDVFAVHLVSEADRDASSFGDVRFVDAETG